MTPDDIARARLHADNIEDVYPSAAMSLRELATEVEANELTLERWARCVDEIHAQVKDLTRRLEDRVRRARWGDG